MGEQYRPRGWAGVNSAPHLQARGGMGCRARRVGAQVVQNFRGLVPVWANVVRQIAQVMVVPERVALVRRNLIR